MEPGDPIDRVPRVHLELGVPRYVWVAVAALFVGLGLASVIVAATYAEDRTAARETEAFRARRDTLALDRTVDSLLGASRLRP